MTLKEDMATDRAIFINPDEFGESFVWNAATIYGIFSNAYEAVEMGEVPASTTQPAAEFKDSNVVGIKQGDPVTRTETGIVYKVTGVQPSGTGWVMVLFSRD